MPAGKGKFKVVVQQPSGGITFDLAEGAYAIEREALDPIGAEIVEVPAKTEDEFIAAAKDADAVIARNRRITAAIIKGLKNCKVIGLGSVGADTVDVDAATEAGIVVTNVPDVFIDEVADHTMAMFLAAHRRLRLMHQLTVDAKWTEGRPYFKDIPRLYGQTIGLISFGPLGNNCRDQPQRAVLSGGCGRSAQTSRTERCVWAISPQNHRSRRASDLCPAVRKEGPLWGSRICFSRASTMACFD